MSNQPEAKSQLNAALMRKALNHLDSLMTQSVSLIVGGGGAMLLAYDFPLATSDIDAVPRGIDLAVLDIHIKAVARDLNIPSDWLNPYFSTFAHTLPSDYGDRLINVFRGKHLEAWALGMEDLLIMKCFAHRQKDIGHAKALIKKGANIKFVESHIESLQKKRIPGSQDALDFLDELRG